MDRISQLTTALSDRYRIERELGAGGMATVYVAEDLRHRRKVAIKVLRAELAAALGPERFLREIETTANLRHPHILPLYDSGQAGEFLYYVMPLVEGESLRDRLTREKQLPIEEALGIAREVADALGYAHSRGIIHRDIKPENILLEGGHAVVADFGIARAVSAAGADKLTRTGMSIGTPSYMSPEQAAGEENLDGRSDLYALGCVLFEMLGGQPPFTGPTVESVVHQHLMVAPPPITNLRPTVPVAVAGALARTLAKNPADRFNPASQFVQALSGAGVTTTQVAEPVRAPKRWPLGVAAAAVLILIAAALLLLPGRNGAPRAEAGSDLRALAVLPFVNTSGDAKDEYFSDGITDELAHALSKLPGLTLAGRSSSFSFKGKSVPAPEIGKVLNVGAIVEGTVRRSGDRLRVTVQLTSTSDGRVLWSDAFERAGADVFAVQDAFTSAIVGALTPLLGGAAAAPVSAGVDTRGTSDAAAYDFYLRGRYYWAQRGAGPLDTALAFFQQGVQRDSSFARGWAGLALTHVMRPNFNSDVAALPAFAAAESAGRKALALDSTLADAHLAIAMSRMRQLDLAAADRGFAAARRLEPQNATSHHWSGLYYWLSGDSTSADRELDLALTLDPLSATTVNSRAVMMADRRRFMEAKEGFRRAGDLSAAFATTYSNAIRMAVWQGKADSVAVARQVYLPGKTRGRWGVQVFALAAAGRWKDARQLRDSVERGAKPGVLVMDRGMAALAFGEYARAAELLVESMEREGLLTNVFFSLCDPMLDRIRDQPAFISFLQRHGLPQCPYQSPWPIATSAGRP